MCTITLEMSARYFLNINRIILKVIWKNKGIAKTILKEKTGRVTLQDLKSYYIASVIKAGWH
jgi:hypothetical protein